MRGHKQYPFERSREYLFDTLYGGAGVSGCCSPKAGVAGGVDYGDELIAQSSTCYRPCPDGSTAQICPVGSLTNNALETAIALSNRACPTGTQLRASAGAGSQRSQSTSQHNSPKEFTKLLRSNARWKVLSLPIGASKWRRETQGVRIRCKQLSFSSPFPHKFGGGCGSH